MTFIHIPANRPEYDVKLLISIATQLMSFSFIQDQQYADYLDAMADLIAEQQEAMYQSDPEEWIGYEPEADYRGALSSELCGPELSAEEVNACDHYNERYVLPTND